MKSPKTTRPMTIQRNQALLDTARAIRAEELARTGKVPTLRRIAVLSVYHAAPSYFVEPNYLYKLWIYRNGKNENEFRQKASAAAVRQRQLLAMMRKYIDEDQFEIGMAIRLISMKPAPRFYLSVDWAMSLLKGKI